MTIEKIAIKNVSRKNVTFSSCVKITFRYFGGMCSHNFKISFQMTRHRTYIHGWIELFAKAYPLRLSTTGKRRYIPIWKKLTNLKKPATLQGHSSKRPVQTPCRDLIGLPVQPMSRNAFLAKLDRYSQTTENPCYHTILKGKVSWQLTWTFEMRR